MNATGRKRNHLARIVCVLALLFLGLSHKPSGVIPLIPYSELALYVMPDGSLPVICSEDMHAGGLDKGHASDVAACEACILSGSALLPCAPTLALPPARIIPAPPLARTGTPHQPFRLTAAPRGPPAFPSA